MVKDKPLTVEEKIVKHISENGLKTNWLAKKLDISVGHLYCVLKGEGNQKRDLTDGNRHKINAILGTNF